jgi:hypothetical protein
MEKLIDIYERWGGLDFPLFLALLALAVTGILGLCGVFDPAETIYHGDDYE